MLRVLDSNLALEDIIKSLNFSNKGSSLLHMKRVDACVHVRSRSGNGTVALEVE